MKSATHKTTALESAKRIVIKIGSSLLVDEASGQIRRPWMDALIDDIAVCKMRGQEVIIVTSGAIAVGRRPLHLPPGPLRLEEKQAAAAAGQIRLAHAYQESLLRHEITAAQVLLTVDDSENRRRYLNARNTLSVLLRQKAVPLINENDTVATQEIRVGDNDRLAARVAQMISADVLILFSDIDGLYTANPRIDPQARFIPEVHSLTPEIETMAGDSGSAFGSGGMVTKLAAARIALSAGCAMAIALGKPVHCLKILNDGGPCTWFHPSNGPRAARKQWIAGSIKPTGVLHVDAGAGHAMQEGSSLLPAGVTMIEGVFQRGDTVMVRGPNGRILARGLSAYSAGDAALIIGHKSSEIEDILGYRGRDEIIHRDDLVLE